MTNIVIFDVKAPLTGEIFLEKIGQFGIKAALFGPNTVRFVTHLHITSEMVEELIRVLQK